jgi:hypothetical protein
LAREFGREDGGLKKMGNTGMHGRLSRLGRRNSLPDDGAGRRLAVRRQSAGPVHRTSLKTAAKTSHRPTFKAWARLDIQLEFKSSTEQSHGGLKNG